jgi:arabinofuranan 3-O-arabinosyltransferase
VVEPCPDGCWIVLGEGYNDAWQASAGGADLGPPQLIDGGFNGWWLPATTTATTVSFHWAAQRAVAVGLIVSIATVIACLAIVATTRLRRDRLYLTPRLVPLGHEPSGQERPGQERHGQDGPGRRWIVPLALLVAGALLISPVWGVVGGVLGVVAALVPRWANLLGWFGLGLALAVALAVLWIERRDSPIPNAGWTESFDSLNGLAVLAVLCVTVGAMSTDKVRSSCAP